MEQLNKENIKSLIGSVFAMQSIEVPFEVGSAYKFEMKFIVRDEYLELEGGSIKKILREKADGELEPESST